MEVSTQPKTDFLTKRGCICFPLASSDLWSMRNGGPKRNPYVMHYISGDAEAADKYQDL